MNYNDTTRGALVDSIDLYKGKFEKGGFEGNLDIKCKDCYVCSSRFDLH